MASTFSHAIVGLALGTAFRPADAPRRFWVLGAVCAALPDVDVLGRPFGNLRYEEFFGGHRALTHSLMFAVVLGAAVAWGAFRGPQWSGARGMLWAYFTLATASHGFIDALTAYGDGVAFLAPFSWGRFTFPWHPIDPSNSRLGVRSLAGILIAAFRNEVLWLWVPSLLFATGAVWWRRRGNPK